MHFYIHLNRSQTEMFVPEIITSSSLPDNFPTSNLIYFLGKGEHLITQKITTGTKILWIFGDPIYNQNNPLYYRNLIENFHLGNFLREVDGFYYLMLLDKKSGKMSVSSSIFSMLPVYYYQNHKVVIITSSFDLILKDTTVKLTIDQQYYLEKAIFNYALFDRTPFLEIKVIPSNSLLEYDGRLNCTKHTNISDYYVDKPRPWRKSINLMSDIFIDQAKAFFPKEKFYATFTGGFDGRTVIALAKSLKLDFATYSYGSAGDPDIEIPLKVCKKLNIPYSPVLLDNKFASDDWWDHANEFLRKSFGTGNFSRSQYHFILSTLLKNEKYLLSGNFGSEVIRAMKIPGVMTSEILFSLFDFKGIDALKKQIQNYPGVFYLTRELINSNLNSLLSDIQEYLKNLPSELSVNKRFYIYMYEEVFRKYFGPEIMVQRLFLNHRAPFLSFRFIQELLKTEIAGANSEFLESNPLKRYRGQVLYAYILKKTYPQLLMETLDRGYKPNDFLRPAGIINITSGYLLKKYLIKRDKSTPSYSSLCINKNLSNIEALPADEKIFNTRYLSEQIKDGWKNNRMHFINSISAISYYNEIKDLK